MSKHPSEVLGDHAGWAPPRKPGSFFYPQGCALKAPPSKLSQVIFTDQLDTIDNTLFSPQSPLIKAIEAREGALTPLEQLSAVWPKELSAEWTLMSFTSSVQTSLKGLRYEGCGASACDMTLVFNKELKETLVRYPTASFQTPPTLIKPQALALQVSARPTAQKDPKAHQITGAHYQALLNNINALAIRDRLPGERFALAAKKTFCSAKTISIYSIKTTPYLPYLLHCSVPNKQSEIEEADHKAWRALQTHEQLPETLKGEWGQEGYLFHGLFLFDGQSTVRPIEFYWGSEERTFVEPPELGIDINGDGVYQVIYHQGYYEGNASTLFDAERGWLRFTTLYANGA